MNVLSVSSELFPLIKTGGLADVTGALPQALEGHGVATVSLIPAYSQISRSFTGLEEVARLRLLDEQAIVLRGNHNGAQLLLLDCPAFFERPGGPYLDAEGRDHDDNWKRFAALSLAAAKVAAGEIPDWTPDIVHTHDWQAALTPAYMKDLMVETPTVLTIHNLAFQGQFPARIFPALGLSPHHFDTGCMEYYGDISFLKAGIALSDIVTTVSPTYAREILTPELGMGMNGFLSTRRDSLRGIINGIDENLWNPTTDPLIPAKYDIATIEKRHTNRTAVEDRFGLVKDDGAILSVISRLTWQKGLDLLEPIIPGIVDRGAKLVVYGQGDPAMIAPLAERARQYAGRVVLSIDFNEADAHLLHSGSDMVLQPSRFEPCGLTQLYALRYGAIPIVARTGGLAETIIDANEAAMDAKVATGFQFQPGSVEDFYHAVDRALTAFGHPSFWRQLQVQAMKANFSWQRSARRYAALYRSLLPTEARQEL
ncbi:MULTISPECIES: glycogen synthase GlgA [unclassified Rhizobium]|uniref:glycogen synthase GlgA n=1 Tax=unclassified Rhizobium TaxID=2613769 RepID=UPI0006FB6B72|nr:MULTISPECIES: glycogen synthase GlgA [unclassified Rhizobium]KQV44588.1 glycogen synthase [Rhizobium sp. Root1212]KRD38771.1 glycogen synthase [Rhizobium sp. Root268]